MTGLSVVPYHIKLLRLSEWCGKAISIPTTPVSSRMIGGLVPQVSSGESQRLQYHTDRVREVLITTPIFDC